MTVVAFAICGAAFAQSSAQKYQQADAELNRVYKELRALLAPANQKKLKDWQMKWVQKNEKMTKKASDPTDKASLLLEPTQTRLAELEELLAEIKMDAEHDLDFEGNDQGHHFSANGLNDLLTRDFPEESLRLTLGITLPPGISYTGRAIRDMWPELRYRSTEGNKKLHVHTFSEPEEGNAIEGHHAWHNGYHISADASVAIVEAMDDAAFYSDGVEGQTCYYVYQLPALADVPRNVTHGTAPKEILLRPFKSLTKAQLAEAYPDAAAPKAENTRAVESQEKSSDAEPKPTEVPDAKAISIPREFIGTWDSRPMSEESQVQITEKEMRYYLGEVVGRFVKITRTTPNQIVCEMKCTEIEETWKETATLTLLAGGKQLKFNNREGLLYRSKLK